MSRKPDTSPAEVLAIVASELTYSPTEDQRRAKSAFWLRFQDNPLCDPSEVSLATALRFVSEERLSKWWDQEGFRNWFLNRDEFREKVDHLVTVALDRMYSIISDPRANQAAQISAIKMVMELAQKMPRGGAEKYLDEKISQMDKRQLEDYINKKIKLLPRTVD